MGKKDQKGSTNTADVDVFLNQIKHIVKQYSRLLEKITIIKNDKKKVNERMDMLNERKSLKEQFIAKKQSARANIKLLAEGMNALKDQELRECQEEFREIDAEFRSLGLMAEQDALFEGAAARKAGKDGFDPSKAKNDDLLDKSKQIHESTLDKLVKGLQTVESTKDQAKITAQTLVADREKLVRIDSSLDDVQSELQLSRVLMGRFVKRLYTDKVIIAFAFLLVAGLVGIIVYATLNKNQTLFSVPNAVTDVTGGALTDATTLGKDALALLSASASPSIAPSPLAAPARLLLRGAVGSQLGE